MPSWLEKYRVRPSLDWLEKYKVSRSPEPKSLLELAQTFKPFNPQLPSPLSPIPSESRALWEASRKDIVPLPPEPKTDWRKLILDTPLFGKFNMPNVSAIALRDRGERVLPVEPESLKPVPGSGEALSSVLNTSTSFRPAAIAATTIASPVAAPVRFLNALLGADQLIDAKKNFESGNIGSGLVNTAFGALGLGFGIAPPKVSKVAPEIVKTTETPKTFPLKVYKRPADVIIPDLAVNRRPANIVPADFTPPKPLPEPPIPQILDPKGNLARAIAPTRAKATEPLIIYGPDGRPLPQPEIPKPIDLGPVPDSFGRVPRQELPRSEFAYLFDESGRPIARQILPPLEPPSPSGRLLDPSGKYITRDLPKQPLILGPDEKFLPPTTLSKKSNIGLKEVFEPEHRVVELPYSQRLKEVQLPKKTGNVVAETPIQDKIAEKATKFRLRKEKGESKAEYLQRRERAIRFHRLRSNPVNPSNWKQMIADRKNAYNAANYEEVAVERMFRKYNEPTPRENFAKMTAISRGIEKAPEEVRKFLDDKFAEIKATFRDEVDYRQNFLPIFFKENPREVANIFERIFADPNLAKRGAKEVSGIAITDPRFTHHRVINDIEQGIALGLTPRFNNLSEYLGKYAGYTTRAIADRKLFDYAIASRLIRPVSELTPAMKEAGWRILDPNVFPRLPGPDGRPTYWIARFTPHKFEEPSRLIDRIKDKTSIRWTEEFGDVIEDQLKDPTTQPWSTMAGISRWSSNITLTGGIPGTGINYHGLANIPNRVKLLSNNPYQQVKDIVRTLYWDIRPGKAEKYLYSDPERTKQWIKHGLKLGGETLEVGKKPQTVAQVVEGWFANAMFQKILPAIKLRKAEDIYKELLASGMKESEAMKKASQIVNHALGGVNNLQDFALGTARYRNAQQDNMLRAILLAPDWAETKYRLAKGALGFLKNPKDPVAQKYALAVAWILTYIAAASAARRMITGTPAPDIRRAGNIPLPMLNVPGREAEWTPGTAHDPVTIPLRLIESAVSTGDKTVIETAVSIALAQLSNPAQTALEVIRGEDFFGRPLHPLDRFRRPVPYSELFSNYLGEIADMTVPQYAQGLADVLTGRKEPIEGVSQGLEFPIRWYKKRR